MEVPFWVFSKTKEHPTQTETMFFPSWEDLKVFLYSPRASKISQKRSLPRHTRCRLS